MSSASPAPVLNVLLTSGSVHKKAAVLEALPRWLAADETCRALGWDRREIRLESAAMRKDVDPLRELPDQPIGVPGTEECALERLFRAGEMGLAMGVGSGSGPADLIVSVESGIALTIKDGWSEVCAVFAVAVATGHVWSTMGTVTGFRHPFPEVINRIIKAGVPVIGNKSESCLRGERSPLGRRGPTVGEALKAGDFGVVDATDWMASVSAEGVPASRQAHVASSLEKMELDGPSTLFAASRFLVLRFAFAGETQLSALGDVVLSRILSHVILSLPRRLQPLLLVGDENAAGAARKTGVARGTLASTVRDGQRRAAELLSARGPSPADGGAPSFAPVVTVAKRSSDALEVAEAIRRREATRPVLALAVVRNTESSDFNIPFALALGPKFLERKIDKGLSRGAIPLVALMSE